MKNKLKEIRISKGITQENLAEATGISERSISDIENDKRTPYLHTAIKISEAVGVTVNDIFFLE